jgi:hypothetical protein
VCMCGVVRLGCDSCHEKSLLGPMHACVCVCVCVYIYIYIYIYIYTHTHAHTHAHTHIDTVYVRTYLYGSKYV